MIKGMTDSGINLTNQILTRAIDATDILIATALPDLSQTVGGTNALFLGFSSISSCGNSTLQDSSLSGHLIITRLMDWSTHSAFYQNHLLIVNIPSEGDEQKWISLTFAGFLGSLSGINESGVTVRDISKKAVVPGENLVATNHFQTLYTQESCYRYNGIVDSLGNSTEISTERSWKILQKAACLSWNLHAIQYIESANLLKWAASITGSLAYAQEPTSFYLDELFNYQTSIDEHIYVNQNHSFILKQNYPNPFNPSTSIEYELFKSGHVYLAIYDLLGRHIRTLVDVQHKAGCFQVVWNGKDVHNVNVASGLYFCRMEFM